jgi:hypothetical protein
LVIGVVIESSHHEAQRCSISDTRFSYVAATMTDKASQLAEAITGLPEREFLELDRTTHRSSAQHEFTQASIHTLAAGAFATMAGIFTYAGGPVGLLAAVPAGVCVNAAIRSFGRGIQESADSVSSDTTLRLAYEHEAFRPGQRIQEAASIGRLAEGPAQRRQS